MHFTWGQIPNQKQLAGSVDISNQYSSFVHFPVMNVQFSAKRKKKEIAWQVHVEVEEKCSKEMGGWF